MGLSKSNPPTAQVKLLISPTSGHIPWSLFSWLALGSGAVFFVAVILSGAKLIIDPYSPNWLKTAFPGLVNNFETPPQTANEIQEEIRSQGFTAGPTIAWPKVDTARAWFYPILNKDNNSIAALWVYRVRGNQLQRVEQVSIRPVKESFITTPLVGTAAQVTSVDSDANLFTIKLMPSQSADVPWIALEGRRRYGNTVMRYGQILSYQPHSQRLHKLLTWSSPTDQPPQWQTSTHGHQLVIDQTIGLRPSFLLYQLVPKNPPQLQEVSLYRSVYEASDLSTSLYDKALQLSQGAIWSHSVQMMHSAKKALGQNWSDAAQAQLDLIELHAKHTKAQTKQTLSNHQQHILAYLIDGQWNKALTTLEKHPTIYGSLLKRLEREFDALWRGVSIHLQVHPKDEATQIWGALLVTARQSPEVGQDWLKKKTRSQKTLKRLQAVGKIETAKARTNIETTDNVINSPRDSPIAEALPNATTLGRYLNLVGQAQSITKPGEGWLRSQSLPTPLSGQTWYQIHIQLLQDKSGWRAPSSSITAANFWTESLSLHHQIQLFSRNQPVGRVTVHGVKANGNDIALLAIGPKTEGTSLVATDSSLRWLNTLPWQTAPGPQIFTVEHSNRVNDASVNSDQTAAVSELDTLMSTKISQQLGLTNEQMVKLKPHLNYASLDLVGDNAAEHLFSIGYELPPEFALTPGKTIIFSSIGEILYSDFEQQQSLLAITSKQTEQSGILLLVEQPDRYTLIGL
ncbi:MAG: hypothetical protein F6K11_08625 [Leptolyngbya sp. SIO3F4]|nr:hypothetical protein [Leptolyngbya sp. SIO3F4]